MGATKDIGSGEEVTMSYSNGHPSPGIDLLAKHGFTPANAATEAQWTAEDCVKIQKVLTPEMTHGKSKMLEAVGRLVDQSCPTTAGGATPSADDSQADKIATASVSDTAKADADAGLKVADSDKADAKIAASAKDEPPAVQMMHPLLALAAPFAQRPCRPRVPRDSSFL